MLLGSDGDGDVQKYLWKDPGYNIPPKQLRLPIDVVFTILNKSFFLYRQYHLSDVTSTSVLSDSSS